MSPQTSVRGESGRGDMKGVIPAVLSIAGSDSSGGAGIQADIKTIESMGLFAETAITALTAQNTLGVRGVVDTDPAFVEAQIDAVFEDIRPQAVKVGMVSSPAIVEAIAAALIRHRAENIVVDPVMVATSGSSLIEDGTVVALRTHLFPLARVITPNLAEAEVLSQAKITTKAQMAEAARAIAASIAQSDGTPCAVLVKGGHAVADSSGADDVLFCPGAAQELRWFEGSRIENPNTHGTGCTLSSAIACGLALGKPLDEAIADAKAYISGALRAGLALGKGSGPIDHMWSYR